MSKEILLDTANKILSKYNLLFRYARYNIHEPAEADLIVKDARKEYNIGLIKMQRDEVLKFYVGEVNFYSCDYELANQYREKLMQLYRDIDQLNMLSLLLKEEEDGQ